MATTATLPFGLGGVARSALISAAEYAIFIGLAQSVQDGRAGVYVDALVKAGISRYWFSSDALASIIQTAINKRQVGEPLGFIDLLVSADLTPGQQALWAGKWAEAQDKDPIEGILEYTKQLRRDAALREVQDVMGAIKDYSVTKPRDVLLWLPTVIQTLRAIQVTGQQYDPKPSAIWETGYVPRVVGRFSKSPTLNQMFGGGLWDGCLMLYGTPTSQGKSTFTYTVIAHAVVSGHKVVLFSREASAIEATARIVQAYGGFTRSEVENKQGGSPQRHQALRRTLRELDRYLSIYDRHSAALGDFGEIIHWEQPALAVVDHIGLYGATDPRAGLQIMGKRDPLGDLAEYLFDITREEHLTILATSQFSAGVQLLLHKDHDLNPVVYYSSTRIANAADIAYIAMRYWKMPDLQWHRCKKDRMEGKMLNRVWYSKYVPEWRCYYEYEPAG